MQSKFDSLNKSCGSAAAHDPPGCSESDIDAVLLRRNLANVSWGLAAAAAATAGVLFFVEGRSVSVTPMVGEPRDYSLEWRTDHEEPGASFNTARHTRSSWSLCWPSRAARSMSASYAAAMARLSGRGPTTVPP